MDEYRMDDCRDEHRIGELNRRRAWKYLGIIFATLLGSFLAFYFAASCTINHFTSHTYMMKQMRRMEKIGMRDFEKTDKSFERDLKGMQKWGGMFQHKSAVDFLKTPDSYKFIVDLTPFQGNSDAVKLKVDGNEIEISAESVSGKKYSETYTKMSQTYVLCPKARLDKLSKKTVNDKYVITVPIED